MNKLDDYMRFQEIALSVRGQRQQLLASNIANADTPNYKARDIDFSAAMSAAMSGASNVSTAQGVAGQLSKTSLNKTSSAHLNQPGAIHGVAPLYRKEVQGSVDGNTVDMDVERNAFTDNALRYEASLTLLNMQIRSMLSAIQGQ